MSLDDDHYHYQDRISASREPEDLLTHDEREDLVKRLTQAWINERAAPEILKYENDCVNGLIAKCDDQQAVIDELDTGNDASILISILYQTELERIKFVLRSYLRTRISKIERHCQFILKDLSSRRKLSKAETSYAESYLKTTQDHYHSSFLSSLPLTLQVQDDVVFHRKMNMVSEPSLDEGVFCRINEDIGYFQLGEGDPIVMETGQIYIFRYGAIRALLQRGQISLI
ncbi:GINS complex subunit [Mortierella antarctica]|nr:GINS complex subunit [Mortierella antarctica]